MKVELKQIIDQLTEACELNKNYKVSALINDNGDISGWCIVKVYNDGHIKPINNIRFNNIKELIEAYI